MKRLADFGPSIVLTIILLFVWEGVTQANFISSRILPSPSLIIVDLLNNFSIIAPHMIQTIIETLIGFVLAIILGVAVALVIDQSRLIRNALYPLLITSQTIPMIALAPLFLIWFGIDLLPKVIIVILVCFFPIVVATADGLRITDPDLEKLLKSMNATYWQTLRYVRIPNSLPQFFSGVKIAATYSVTGAIVGEYVGAYQGLGIYMQEMANSHAIPLVFAAILVTSLLSILLFGIVVLIEKKTIRWRQEERFLKK